METPALDFQPTVPVFIRRLAAAQPELDLIVTADGRMTYGDVEASSRRLAKELLARGVGKGTRVAFMFGNGIEWVVTWLAIARIGGLAMPFCTVYKPAELRTALRLGDVDTLIVPATLLGKDHLAFVEEALPSLAGAAPPFRLPEAPYLRSVLVAGGTDRAWATPVDVGAGGPPGHPIPASPTASSRRSRPRSLRPT